MNTYKAKWRRLGLFSKFFTKTEKGLNGHRYWEAADKMVFYYLNGSLKEVARWSQCEISLGTDWVLFTKEQMEKEANAPVKLAVDVTAKVK